MLTSAVSARTRCQHVHIARGGGGDAYGRIVTDGDWHKEEGMNIRTKGEKKNACNPRGLLRSNADCIAGKVRIMANMGMRTAENAAGAVGDGGRGCHNKITTRSQQDHGKVGTAAHAGCSAIRHTASSCISQPKRTASW